MKKTIEIDDNLDDLVSDVIRETRDLLLNYLEDYPDTNKLPCLHNDLDYNGAFHEICDSTVPIYTKNIEDLFFLYGSELEEAFDDAGIGDKNDKNWPIGWKPVAIYCYLEQKACEWYHNEAEEIFDNWKFEQFTTQAHPQPEAAVVERKGNFEF